MGGKKPYRAGIFDLNGTLNDMSVLREQDKYVASVEFGLTLTDEDVANVWGQKGPTFYPALFRRPQHEWEELRATFDSYTHLFPRRLHADAIPTLHALRSAGVILGLVTGGEADRAHQTMREIGLPLDYFAFVHTQEDTATEDEELTKGVRDLADRGISRDETVFVGDEPANLRAARVVGVGFIAVACGTASPEKLLAAGVPAEDMVMTLGELPVRFGLPPQEGR